MKQPIKNAVPRGARWTKINRRIVSPEVLEIVSERFDEHPDHVVVKRVITKEQIQELAYWTRYVRGKMARVPLR